METRKIIVLGILPAVNKQSTYTHLQDYVYSEDGISPTLTARDYKDPRRILIKNRNGELTYGQ